MQAAERHGIAGRYVHFVLVVSGNIIGPTTTTRESPQQLPILRCLCDGLHLLDLHDLESRPIFQICLILQSPVIYLFAVDSYPVSLQLLQASRLHLQVALHCPGPMSLQQPP